MNDYEKAVVLQRFNANKLAELLEYDWDDEYRITELNESKETILKIVGEGIDISTFTKEQVLDIGCKKWDIDGALLIPLWLFSSLKEGVELKSIGGESVKYSKDLDKDSRFGVVAYGIELDKLKDD